MLKTPLTQEEFDKLRDEDKEHYTEKDGKFLLQVEGVEDTSGLKSALEKERAAVKKLKKELNDTIEKYKDIDPDKAREAQKKLDELEEKKLMDSGEVDKLFERRTERMKADHGEQLKIKDNSIKDLTDKFNASQRKLQSVLIDSALRTKAIQGGVLETGIEDVVLRGHNVWKLSDKDEPVPTKRDAEGNEVVMFGKDGSNPMSMEEWIDTLKKPAPHLFKPSSGGGADNTGSLTLQGSSIIISGTDAKDTTKYRAAREQAEKQGKQLVISE